MDYVSLATLSTGPSLGMDKEANILRPLGAIAGWGKRLWGGMRSARNVGRAKALQQNTIQQPWYSKLKFWKDPKPGAADFANPAYRGAGANLRPIQKAHDRLTENDGLARFGAGLYNKGKSALGFGAAATTPLALTHVGMEPVRNTRHYAHGYTDAATMAAEELSNTPWWKIMGLGLGKLGDKDIIWNKLISPMADRGVWDTFKQNFDTGGFRDGISSAMKVMGAREMMQKRDLQRRLWDDPETRQGIIDQLVEYQKRLLDAQAAQNIQS